MHLTVTLVGLKTIVRYIEEFRYIEVRYIKVPLRFKLHQASEI